MPDSTAESLVDDRVHSLITNSSIAAKLIHCCETHSFLLVSSFAASLIQC